MTRAAFVIPWFGQDLVGGAEQHIFQVATRLAKRGHRIEVLATCCRSFPDDWQENQLREGVSEECGVTVRRFPVSLRDVAAFERANRELLELNDRPKPIGVCPVTEGAARAFVEENIHSPKLLDHLDREAQLYRAIVFAPYLYGPTLHGVERARGRAFLQPMLHDETYAYLPQVEAIFHSAKRVLFNSEGEAVLAARLYGPSMWRKGVITGEGVEVPEVALPSADRRVDGVAQGSYALYLGRRDRTKNTDFLIRAFELYRASHPEADLQLVLAGPGDRPARDARRPWLVDLGLVSEAEKSWLLANCRVLVQPSRNESYSRTVMEAWFHAKPVIVHGDCLATSLAVDAAGGGWTAATEAEWADLFHAVEPGSSGELEARGRRGRAYAREHADWDKALDRYEQALELRSPAARAGQVVHPRLRVRAIHQLLPNLVHGDAISNQATFIREALRDLGYHSEILVQHVDDAMSELGRPFEPRAVAPGDGVLYHHSIGTALTAHAMRHAGPKALIYHNITPASFFEPWDPAFARLLEAGRRDLQRLAPAFPISCGDSAYNAAELQQAGFRDPGVLPIFVDPLRWAQPADPAWMKALQDGRTNLLFVGRVAPNKCQDHLLEAFKEYLSFDPEARLILVGSWKDGDSYAIHLRELAQRLGVTAHVVLARSCTDAQLLACYRTAHLLWSMSEHEGFCVPLIESMWFDVPVLAYSSSAVPETLAAAGLLFTEKRWPELAALAHLLVEDRALRAKVIAAQRTRRLDFLPEASLPAFFEMIRAITGEASSTRAAS